MKTAVATLKSVTTYSPGRPYSVERIDKENDEDYEKRTWRERLHYTKDGNVYIPPTCFKNALTDAAQYLALKIKGKGTSTYTKHFRAGVLVSEPLILPDRKDDVRGDWHFVPSDGKPGGGKRVWKRFPKIDEWSGQVRYHILDGVITEAVFRDVLEVSGNLIGIGVFRPIRNGFQGRFDVVDVEWIQE